jgi:hypothetical protein
LTSPAAETLPLGLPWGADPGSKDQAGKSYVIFGKKDSTVIELSAIASGTGGFVINGENANDQSGFPVSTAGGVNGDGLDDLIVGAWRAGLSSKADAGKSYVIFGKGFSCFYFTA